MFQSSGCCLQAEAGTCSEILSLWLAGCRDSGAQAARCLFQSGVYSKLASYVMNMTHDRVWLRTESLLHPQSLCLRYRNSSAVSRWSSCHPVSGRASSLWPICNLNDSPQSSSGWKGVFGPIAETEVGSRRIEQ